jgi:hypothetical protein
MHQILLRKQYEEYFQELQNSRSSAGMAFLLQQKSKKSKNSSAHVPIFSYYLTRNAFQGHYFVVLLMEKLPNSYVSAKILCPSFHQTNFHVVLHIYIRRGVRMEVWSRFVLQRANMSYRNSTSGNTDRYRRRKPRWGSYHTNR